jgi:hypothetical protein
MVRNYVPKRAYFSETRVQKMAKEVIKDCQDDRDKALELFSYFMKLVETNPEDDKSKSEMSKALDLAQSSNDKVVKLLDLMLKMTQHEMKDKKPDEFSFEQLQK